MTTLHPPYYVVHNNPHHVDIQRGHKRAFDGPYYNLAQAQEEVGKLRYNNVGIEWEIVDRATKLQLEADMFDQTETLVMDDLASMGVIDLAEGFDPGQFSLNELKELEISPEDAERMVKLEEDGYDRANVKKYLLTLCKGE